MSRLKLMKGYTYEEALKATPKFPNGRIRYPVLIEPKVDEVRVQVLVEGGQVQYLSYAGKPLHNIPESWDEKFREFREWYNIREWDCGIEVNGNFNDTYRFVRSSRGVPEDLEDVGIVLHVYDFPQEVGTYAERRDLIACIVNDEGNEDFPIHQLVAYEAHSRESLEEWYTYFVLANYEGAMVKNPLAGYSRTRSWDWVKMKPGAEADAKVVGLTEAVSAEGEPLGRVGSFIVELEDGSTAEPGAGALKHEMSRLLWKIREEYIAAEPWIVFKYMERDRQGGYRHPRYFRQREDKV